MRVTELMQVARRHRGLVQSGYDLTAWVVSFGLFAWLRYDQVAQQVPWRAVLLTGVAAAAIYLVLGWQTRLHSGRAATGSLEEVLLLGGLTIVVGSVVTVVNAGFPWGVPRSVPVGATLATLVLMGSARAAWRLGDEMTRRPAGRDGSKVLIIGGGDAGRKLVDSMLRDADQGWLPVGIVDDDSRKRHLRVRGVPVLGTSVDLARIAAATGASSAVIAIPSADAQTVTRLRHAAVDAELDVKVLPSTTQLLTDQVGVRDIRDVNLTDVLGRKQLDTDIAAIAGYLAGRRVMVTGAGGSIGSELCRQIHRFAPAELMMLDRDESALHAVQLSIHGRALLDSDEVVLCDIRDRDALVALFRERRPEVVFHAAALKHLPMLEQYPVEAIKSNVHGTRNVLDAVEAADVDIFVNISTDKAANPCSVLGYSKRIAESITAARARHVDGRYVSVRFGNVLGSRGSVLTAFARQIAQGLPVTVTDPDVTRFFMTIEEACQLTIQAAAIGRPGEALVLDMGDPVRILDVARQLMQQSGRRVGVEFTGLRPGEKLHEELFGDAEPRDVRPCHPLVSHVPVPAVDEVDVAGLPLTGDPDPARRAMAAMCVALDAHLLGVAMALRSARSTPLVAVPSLAAG